MHKGYGSCFVCLSAWLPWLGKEGPGLYSNTRIRNMISKNITASRDGSAKSNRNIYRQGATYTIFRSNRVSMKNCRNAPCLLGADTGGGLRGL